MDLEAEMKAVARANILKREQAAKANGKYGFLK